MAGISRMSSSKSLSPRRRLSRHTAISVLSERLTPGEVASLWFRRSPEWAREIHDIHPDFPQPGPDGLYLRVQVAEWFDRWHGYKQNSPKDAYAAHTEEALRIAQHGRG